MTDRSEEKCTQYLTELTNRNKKTTKPKSTDHIPSLTRKLFGIKEKRKPYHCVNSWITFMLNPQSIQNKSICVYTKRCPFCAQTSSPKETKLQQGQFENESCWQSWSETITEQSNEAFVAFVKQKDGKALRKVCRNEEYLYFSSFCVNTHISIYMYLKEDKLSEDQIFHQEKHSKFKTKLQL